MDRSGGQRTAGSRQGREACGQQCRGAWCSPSTGHLHRQRCPELNAKRRCTRRGEWHAASQLLTVEAAELLKRALAPRRRRLPGRLQRRAARAGAAPPQRAAAAAATEPAALPPGGRHGRGGGARQRQQRAALRAARGPPLARRARCRRRHLLQQAQRRAADGLAQRPQTRTNAHSSATCSPHHLAHSLNLIRRAASPGQHPRHPLTPRPTATPRTPLAAALCSSRTSCDTPAALTRSCARLAVLRATPLRPPHSVLSAWAAPAASCSTRWSSSCSTARSAHMASCRSLRQSVREARRVASRAQCPATHVHFGLLPVLLLALLRPRGVAVARSARLQGRCSPRPAALPRWAAIAPCRRSKPLLL